MYLLKNLCGTQTNWIHSIWCFTVNMTVNLWNHLFCCLSHQLQQQLPPLVVPMVVWVVGPTVHFVPWLPSSLSSRVVLVVLWEEALSTDPPLSAPPLRAPLFSHKVLASPDQVLRPWASASPPPPPSVPRWGPRWEVLALQVKYTIPI